MNFTASKITAEERRYITDAEKILEGIMCRTRYSGTTCDAIVDVIRNAVTREATMDRVAAAKLRAKLAARRQAARKETA